MVLEISPSLLKRTRKSRGLYPSKHKLTLDSYQYLKVSSYSYIYIYIFVHILM